MTNLQTFEVLFGPSCSKGLDLVSGPVSHCYFIKISFLHFNALFSFSDKLFAGFLLVFIPSSRKINFDSCTVSLL